MKMTTRIFVFLALIGCWQCKPVGPGHHHPHQGQWTLSGGFWAVTVDETDRLFRDGFES